MSIQTFNKDPGARKDYGFDWSDWLGTDTISASTWTVPDGITQYSTPSNTTTTTTIWLTGGTQGQDYLVTNQITTVGGRIEQRSLKIQVRDQQMEFSVQIEGLDKLEKASVAVKQAVADEINKAVFAGAQEIRTEAIKSIQDGNKSGRTYRRRSVTHRASAPGEAPASDTGRLVNSIHAYASGNGEAFTVAGRGTARYAPLLEFGTSKMAPRPFMVPALEKSKAWITNRIQDALRRALARQMGTPSNALQAGIYARLIGYSALTSLIGANKVFDFVPDSTPAAYVVIGDDTAVDWGTKTTDGWETTVTIHCWDFEKAGRKSVKAILSAIWDALHRQESSITVSGFNLIMIRCEFETTMQDTTIEGENDHFYHGIQRYRVLLQA